MKFHTLTIAVALVSVSLRCTDAFSANLKRAFLPTTNKLVSHSCLYMSDDDSSYPSDSSAEEHYDTLNVEAEDVLPTPTDELVDSVLNDLPEEGTMLEISEETRSKINEALLKLETMNPTPEPTSSSLLNGVWSLRYAGGYTSEGALPSPTRQLALFLYSGGYSPGVFALSLAQKLPAALVEIGELEIAISRQQPRVEARVSVKTFGGNSNDIKVKARLDTESPLRFIELYESASVLGQNVDIPEPLQYSRQLYVTYLDEDLLVVRDASGIPEVLVRK